MLCYAIVYYSEAYPRGRFRHRRVVKSDYGGWHFYVYMYMCVYIYIIIYIYTHIYRRFSNELPATLEQG